MVNCGKGGQSSLKNWNCTVLGSNHKLDSMKKGEHEGRESIREGEHKGGRA